jgi:hypothetical protein
VDDLSVKFVPVFSKVRGFENSAPEKYRHAVFISARAKITVGRSTLFRRVEYNIYENKALALLRRGRTFGTQTVYRVVAPRYWRLFKAGFLRQALRDNLCNASGLRSYGIC